MKVSVIIPAYNAEKYLEETLESIVNQTLDEYEIITINDGSTDSTLSILKRYESQYNNFKIIDKQNEGVSAARNDGLKSATGEYIFFYDADDIAELDALDALYSAAVTKKADLVIAGYDIFDNYKTTAVRDLDELITMDHIDKYDPQILFTF